MKSCIAFMQLGGVLAFGLILLLGLLGWNRLGWPAEWRWSLGLTLMIIGNGLAWGGVWQLGWQATSGAKDKLITTGLYTTTRNPQYLGDMLILIGWVILSASALTMVAVWLALIAFVLVPFAEEPWLEAKYGSAYRQYKDTTPRFIVM
jgi:protein-S-isoprenylcysteine O-methyltransferase Ste14